jgi:phage shock protein A
MTEETDDAFNTMASRLIRREALRRAALELSTATPQGLESALAKISAEVTAEAAEIKKTPESRFQGASPLVGHGQSPVRDLT